MTRVLVAEDDDIMRSAYVAKLTTAGFTVDEAADGDEALKLAAANKPDVILLDLLMPRVTGLEFLEKYDVVKKHPDVKVVVFSNSSTPDTAAALDRLGAYKYMMKFEVTPNEMIEIITEAAAAGKK